MDDKHPETVTVELGGKTRRIKLGPAAFRLAEMQGESITMGELESPTMATLCRLLWVGLLPGEPDISERDVVLWLADCEDEEGIIAQVSKSLTRMASSMSAAMDGAKGGAKKKPTRTPRS